MKHLGLNGQYIKNPAAYCRLHRVSLSVKQIRNKHCIEKGCKYFSIYANHSYWEKI